MDNIYTQYTDELKKLLSVDDRTIAVLQDEFDRAKDVGLKAKFDFWVYLALTVISNVLFALRRLNRRIMYGDEDFVFVSCPDPIFRTKNIDLIAHGLKYKIVYLPNFHIKATLQYAQYFRDKCDAVFLSFSIRDIISAARELSRAKFLGSVKRERGLQSYKKLRHQLFVYLVYDKVVRRTFGNVRENKGKWIFEHQKFYFIPAVHFVMESGLATIMLQHGSFFKLSFNYYPLYCDKALCCSEREKGLYMEAGIAPERVEVFGAPLQTLSKTAGREQKEEKYEILILLSATETGKYLKLQEEILFYIKEQYPTKKILLRPRPRSREEDLGRLGEVLQGFDISEQGTPMEVDLNKCSKVITFSEDSVFHLLDNLKPFLIIVPVAQDYPSLQGKCSDASNYKQYIERLLLGHYTGPFSAEEKVSFIGETDAKELNKKFVSFLRTGRCN